MKRRHTTKRITTKLLAFGLAVAFSASAYGQDVSKVKVKKAVGEDTQESALKRVQERSKRLDTDKRDAEKAKIGGPADQDAVAAENEMTPEQIDAIKRKLESKNRQMIKKLDQIISGDPYNEQKPEWMFQKAELLWELRHWEYLRDRAKYNQCVGAAGQGTVDEASCEEPKPDYANAQTIYKEILQQYPGYDRLDEVIFRLGNGLLEAGKGAQAVELLNRLVKNYPNSRYLPDAHLAMGEYLFDKELLGASRDNYKAVLKFQDNPNYDYALYKLGWVYYNQGEYRDSIDTFKSVVERTNEKLGFQNQAINDLVVAFAEVDGGWQEAREYLRAKKGPDFMFKKLGQLAGLYEAQGKDELAVEIYEWFIGEKPNDPKLPQWADSILIARKKEVNDHESLEKEMNRFVAYFDPKGTWWAKNKGDEQAINNATLLTDVSLSYLSNYFHRRAQSNDSKPDYEKAAGYYEKYIDRFPDSVAAFDMNFFLGEILLLNLEQFEKAAAQYQKVVDLYKNGKVPKDAKKEDVDAIVRDSAYAVVQAYNELVKKHHEDSILVEMAKYDESQRAKQATNQKPESVDQPPIPKTPLLKFEEGFVKASDQYSEMYPKSEVTPTVDFVAAEVYKSRGHYDRAVPRYESIIENAPKHRYASFAGNSLLEANYRLKRWDEVEKWGRHLLDNKIFDVTPKQKLESAIVFAINEDAKNLKTDKKTEKAVERWLALAKEFPKSEYAPGAVFNAAAAYEAADEINKAVELYERVVKEYPKNLNAPQSLFVMGAVFESRANFEKAATYFERLASDAPYVNAEGEEVEYKDHANAADALYNAAVLREAMEQYEQAIAGYEKYMELYPEREDIRETRLHLAYLEKEREAWDKAMERFNAFAKRDDLTQAEVVELNFERGLLHTKIKGKGWEDDSDKLFTKTLEAWKELEDAEKAKTKFYAGQARFIQAERVYDDFATTKLEFPMNKLKRSLQNKAELEQKAESMYLEVIEIGSPRWVAASAYRVGQMYKDFADQLYNLPLPEGLSMEQEDQYRMVLDERAFPLQEKALTSFRTALQLALKFKAYNEWSSKSAQEISKLESEAYPITSQDGVEVDHARLNFSTPKPVTSLEVVKERVLRRKAAEPEPEPAAPADPNAPAEGAPEGEVTKSDEQAKR